MDWRPRAALPLLRLRARLLDTTRRFFAARDVLEVQTPVLQRAPVSDPHVHSLATELAAGGRRFLHTSPEYAMKRLLAAGVGDIYQICPVFRDGEAGPWHEPEFTMIEWYRVGFDHRALVRETVELLGELLGPAAGAAVQELSYREALQRHARVDPFSAGSDGLRNALAANGVAVPQGRLDDDDLLDLLVAGVVAPRLGTEGLAVLYDYPASQASLARVRGGNPPVAERFEVYCRGVELANGFHELGDADEQRRRFASDNRRRAEHGLPPVAADEALLAALASGLPDCAGVAVGFERVLMLAAGRRRLSEVLAFTAGDAAAEQSGH